MEDDYWDKRGREVIAERFTTLEAAQAEIWRLQCICGEAYQVLGSVSHEGGFDNEPQIVKMLDNLAGHDDAATTPHKDVLETPFPVNPRREPSAEPEVPPPAGK